MTNAKAETQEAAMILLEQADKDATIVYCHKSEYFYVEEGSGGMIRNFETLIATRFDGKTEILQN